MKLKKVVLLFISVILLYGCSQGHQHDYTNETQPTEVPTSKLTLNEITNNSDNMDDNRIKHEEIDNGIPSNADYLKQEEVCVFNPTEYIEEKRTYNLKEKELIEGKVVQIMNEESLYLDGLYWDNGTEKKKVQLKLDNNPAENGYSIHSLWVGGCHFEDLMFLTGNIYATTFQSEYVFLMVEKNNYSGYKGLSIYRFYQDQNGEHLISMGTINGTLVEVKDNILMVHDSDTILYPHEFYRNFMYVMCSGTFNNNEENENIDFFKLVQIPEGTAPIGNVFCLKYDLNLYDRYDKNKKCILLKDSYINISATDGESWIYVEDYYTPLNGWFKIELKDNKRLINGENKTVKDYFDGLIVGD